MRQLINAFLIAAGLLATTPAGAQTQVTVGTGTGSGTSTPLSTFNEYSVSEAIYLGSEFGGVTGNITAIAYDKASGSSTAAVPNVTIYMKLSSATTVGTNAYTTSLNGYTPVWNGAFPNSASGWQEVVLTTPFPFPAASQQLSVLVVNASGTTIASGRPQFRYTSTSSVKREAGYAGSSAWNGSQSLAPHWERPNTRFTFGPLASCISTLDIAVSNVAATTATLSWSPLATAPLSYDWELRSSGQPGSGAPGLVSSGSVAGTSVPLSSLLPETTYAVYVRSHCTATENSLWSGALSFTTTCAPVTIFPWTATFENFNLPSCWANTTAGTKKWEFVNADAAHGAATPHGGTGMARVDVYNASTANNPVVLQLPVLIPAEATTQLSYWAWIGSGGAAAPLTVQVSADGGNVFTTIYTHNNTANTNAWKDYTMSLGAYAGQAVLIRFVATSNYGSGSCNINLDDITIGAAQPLALKLQSIRAVYENAVNKVSWTAVNEEPGDYYILEYSNDGKDFNALTLRDARGESPSVYNYEEQARAGSTYYRLKMISAGAGVTYSRTVRLETPVSPQVATFTLYPNPAATGINIRLDEPTLRDAVFCLTDVFGKRLQQFSFGKNNVITLPLTAYPAGMYYVTAAGMPAVKFMLVR